MAIAKLLMQYIEKKIIYKSGHAIKLQKRYVDEVFLVARDEDLTKVLETANFVCPSMQFTIEFEANCQLLFLDVYIKKKEDTNIQNSEISIYHKPTFYNQYLNSATECPASHKIAIIKTLETRAFKV